MFFYVLTCFLLPLISLPPPSVSAELDTTQPVLEQVFSQSASLQRRPWKSEYFRKKKKKKLQKSRVLKKCTTQ